MSMNDTGLEAPPESVGQKLFRLERELERLKFVCAQKDGEIEGLKDQLAEANASATELKPLRALGRHEIVQGYTGLPATFVELHMAALDAFAEGYREYGPGAADSLGLAGQWGDLHRKVMKLKRSLWEGHPGYLTREGEEDILKDIIGHCLLALEMMERGFGAGRG